MLIRSLQTTLSFVGKLCRCSFGHTPHEGDEEEGNTVHSHLGSDLGTDSGVNPFSTPSSSLPSGPSTHASVTLAPGRGRTLALGTNMPRTPRGFSPRSVREDAADEAHSVGCSGNLGVAASRALAAFWGRFVLSASISTTAPRGKQDAQNPATTSPSAIDWLREVHSPRHALPRVIQTHSPRPFISEDGHFVVQGSDASCLAFLRAHSHHPTPANIPSLQVVFNEGNQAMIFRAIQDLVTAQQNRVNQTVSLIFGRTQVLTREGITTVLSLLADFVEKRCEELTIEGGQAEGLSISGDLTPVQSSTVNQLRKVSLRSNLFRQVILLEWLCNVLNTQVSSSVTHLLLHLNIPPALCVDFVSRVEMENLQVLDLDLPCLPVDFLASFVSRHRTIQELTIGPITFPSNMPSHLGDLQIMGSLVKLTASIRTINWLFHSPERCPELREIVILPNQEWQVYLASNRWPKLEAERVSHPLASVLRQCSGRLSREVKLTFAIREDTDHSTFPVYPVNDYDGHLVERMLRVVGRIKLVVGKNVKWDAVPLEWVKGFTQLRQVEMEWEGQEAGDLDRLSEQLPNLVEVEH